jgi:hypothetical protein
MNTVAGPLPVSARICTRRADTGIVFAVGNRVAKKHKSLWQAQAIARNLRAKSRSDKVLLSLTGMNSVGPVHVDLLISSELYDELASRLRELSVLLERSS